MLVGAGGGFGHGSLLPGGVRWGRVLRCSGSRAPGAGARHGSSLTLMSQHLDALCQVTVTGFCPRQRRHGIGGRDRTPPVQRPSRATQGRIRLTWAPAPLSLEQHLALEQQAAYPAAYIQRGYLKKRRTPAARRSAGLAGGLEATPDRATALPHPDWQARPWPSAPASRVTATGPPAAPR